jgi:hypothetical protein
MSETTIADLLGVSEGFRVWVVGDSVEETALLDPLPEGVETFDSYAHSLDAVLLLTDDLDAFAEQLDEVLPQLGSVPLVWACFPSAELSAELVGETVHEYGWGATAPIVLDETWAAMRLAQD